MMANRLGAVVESEPRVLHERSKGDVQNLEWEVSLGNKQEHT